MRGTRRCLVDERGSASAFLAPASTRPGSGSLPNPGQWPTLRAPVAALCQPRCPGPPALQSQYTAGRKDGAAALKGWAQSGKSGHELREDLLWGVLLKGQAASGAPPVRGWPTLEEGCGGVLKLPQVKEGKVECKEECLKQLQLGNGCTPFWSTFKFENCSKAKLSPSPEIFSTKAVKKDNFC